MRERLHVVNSMSIVSRFDMNWYIIFAGLLLQAFVLSLILTPLSRAIALKLGVLDYPGERKLQTEPIPLLGGAAIFATFLSVVLINFVLLQQSRALGFDWIAGHVLRFVTPDVQFRLLGFGLGAVLVFVLGLLDDTRALRPEQKLFGQIVAASIPVAFGIRVDLFLDQFLDLAPGLFGNESLREAAKLGVGSLLTVFWIVAIVNAMNFIDNMDGLCAGVSIIASSAFVFCVLPQHEYFVASALVVFAGSCGGFLYYNLSPARLFMGDAGSMFCGYVLAVLAVMTTFHTGNGPAEVAVFAPLLALSIPLFDILSVVWLRIRRRESIMKGDKRHFSHRLVDAGLSQRQAVDFIFLVSGLTGLGAVMLGRVGSLGTALIVAQTIVLYALIGVLMQRTRNNTG